MVYESCDSGRPCPDFSLIDEKRIFTKEERALSQRHYRPPRAPSSHRVKSTYFNTRARSRLQQLSSNLQQQHLSRDNTSYGACADATNARANTAYSSVSPSSGPGSAPSAATRTYFEQNFSDITAIGSGSFGDVFRARSHHDGVWYAIKCVAATSSSETELRRRLDEVKRQQQLPAHRHIVQFYGAWQQQGVLYLQTELCARSLSDVCFANHRIAESDVWGYMIDLLLAVQHLHENRLMHLDIKPDNIFISKEGYCKLGDFGLVAEIDQSRGEDRIELMEGDAAYMAPELMRGCFSPAADIFSLGMTLLELVADLDLPSCGHVWNELRSGVFPSSLASVQRLSGDMRAILEAMLCPDPFLRASASQILSGWPGMRTRRLGRQLDICYRGVRYSLTTEYLLQSRAVQYIAWLLGLLGAFLHCLLVAVRNWLPDHLFYISPGHALTSLVTSQPRSRVTSQLGDCDEPHYEQRAAGASTADHLSIRSSLACFSDDDSGCEDSPSQYITATRNVPRDRKLLPNVSQHSPAGTQLNVSPTSCNRVQSRCASSSNRSRLPSRRLSGLFNEAGAGRAISAADSRLDCCSSDIQQKLDFTRLENNL